MFSTVTINQPRITAFFPILDELQRQINENKDLREKLQFFLDQKCNAQADKQNRNLLNTQNMSPFLKKLFENALVNIDKKKTR